MGRNSGRRDDKTLKASAVLLHRESLAPEDQPGQGQCRLDNLDENSHKHAFAVSDDLKYALRQAIEQLGNEATVQLIAQAKDRKEGIYSGSHALDPDQLSKECLRYMYRILFLFYIEARPELGYLPHQHSAWRSGYSMDSLRDLEMVRLTTEESRQGEYFHHSLQRMFGLIYQGYNPTHYHSGNEHKSESASNAFTLQGLDSHLFDPAKTPLLNRVIFSNATLQQVVQSMSLTRPAKGKRRRGRVSYTQLGINQLGAVYEALLATVASSPPKTSTKWPPKAATSTRMNWTPATSSPKASSTNSTIKNACTTWTVIDGKPCACTPKASSSTAWPAAIERNPPATTPPKYSPKAW